MEVCIAGSGIRIGAALRSRTRAAAMKAVVAAASLIAIARLGDASRSLLARAVHYPAAISRPVQAASFDSAPYAPNAAAIVFVGPLRDAEPEMRAADSAYRASLLLAVVALIPVVALGGSCSFCLSRLRGSLFALRL